MDIGSAATATYSGNATGGQAMAGGTFNGTMSTIKILPPNTNDAGWNLNNQVTGGFIANGTLQNVPAFGNTSGNGFFHLNINIPTPIAP